MLEFFTPIRVADITLTKIQGAVEEAFKKLTKAFPMVHGILLEDVTLDTTLRTFNHGLGRKPRGYIVVRRSTGAVVFDEHMDANTIHFKASVTTVCTIWVF